MKLKDIHLGKNFWIKDLERHKDSKGRRYYSGTIMRKDPHAWEWWGDFSNYAKNKKELKKQIIKRLKYQKDL